ncbi:MAG TPA: potassium transporter TrkG, partial [Syntrophales bacterium]|nr:potassium transporter TrkG [Syntrophales bacterium]
MSFRNVLSVLGGFLIILGATMLLPLGCSLLYGEEDAAAFLLSFAVTCGSGALLFFCFRPKEKQGILTHREGFLIVSMGWISAALFGSLPFMIQGVLPSFADAFFETMSGFTTTGATVIRNIDPLPRGILLWRALAHWLGGMGIIILAVAILPFL